MNPSVGRINQLARSIGASPTMSAAGAGTSHPDPINLAVGEPAEPPPDFVVEAACDALRKGHTKYGPATGLPELREALAAEQTRRDGVPRNADHVIVTAGSKPALLDTLRVLLDPGDEVLVLAPYWPSFLDQVQWAGGKPVVVTSHSDLPDPDAVAAAITPRTTMLIVNSPNNPSGRVYDHARLRAIADLVVSHDLWVLIDQAYVGLELDGLAPTLLAVAPELADRAIIAESFSKRFAMTGLRLGAALAPPDVIDGLARLATAGTTHPCIVTQHAGLAALQHGGGWIEVQRDNYRRRRAMVLDALRELPGVKTPRPEAAMYVFPDVGELLRGLGFKSDSELTDALLAEAGLRLVPGSAFGFPGCVRLSYGTTDRRLEEGLSRLTSFVTRRSGSTA